MSSYLAEHKVSAWTRFSGEKERARERRPMCRFLLLASMKLERPASIAAFSGKALCKVASALREIHYIPIDIT